MSVYSPDGFKKIMPIINLPGSGRTSFHIPENRLGEVISPAPAIPAPNPEEVIRKSLSSPIGGPPLRDLLRPELRVAIIVDDITRETPTRVILPIVLKELAQAGVARDDVSLVLALGTHRPMTSDEIERKLGSGPAREYRVVNVSAADDKHMKFAGHTSRGIPVRINHFVAETDLRIGIGMISPHLDVGWGGGAKIILPGVCGQETVTAFHEKIIEITSNQLGLADAELRLDLERFVEESVGRLEFIINAVLTSEGRLFECVAGHFIKAHRKGVELARNVYGARVTRQYPVVIAGAHPHGIDIWQATKALAAGEIITSDGGALILVADCPERFGPHPLFADYMAQDPDRLHRAINENRLEDRVAAVEALAICRMKKRIRLGLVSSGLTHSDARRMGFSWYNTVEDALTAELPSEDGAKAAILTHGGVTLPVLE